MKGGTQIEGKLQACRCLGKSPVRSWASHEVLGVWRKCIAKSARQQQSHVPWRLRSIALIRVKAGKAQGSCTGLHVRTHTGRSKKS